MKKHVHYIITSLLCIIAFSCTNDFLSEKSDVSSLSSSTILISPNFGEKDYPIYIPGAGNAQFNVLKTPDWLQVNPSSGNFNNNVASIHCAASDHVDFSDIGIYNDLMLLDITGVGKSLIPVSYIVEGNPVIETEKNLSASYTNYLWGVVPFTVKNTGQGILLFSIVEKPDWVSFNESISYSDPPVYNVFMIAPNSEKDFYLSYNTESLSINDLTGKIVIASNDKNNSETVTNIQVDMGNPLLYCSDSQLNFGRTETTQQINFSNQGDGLLTWKIESCPEWLSVSDTSGILSPISWQTLSFTCNRDLMPSGEQSQTIYLKTNDKNNTSYAITVTAVNYVTNPENIKAIEGAVADAWMDKTADILYLATSQPNRLLAYNMKTRTIDRELSLSKAPNCFSVSEDKHTAVVGHNGLISMIDMDNFSVSKTVEVNNIIYDIELGKDNWCCYSVPNVQWTYLYWVNLNTNETAYSDDIYDSCILHKIPKQDYIMGSEIMISAGLYIFDTNTRKREYNNFTSIGNFCFSEDGIYLYTKDSPSGYGYSVGSYIYRTSSFFVDYFAYVATPIGQFTPAPYQTFWIDPNAAAHSIWILASSSNYYFDNQREIQQYEDNDYTRVNTYYYDEMYNGSPAQAQYIFANSTGNEVVVIKNNSLNEWAIEHVSVTK